MHCFKPLAVLILVVPVVGGCRDAEPTVVMPSDYQLSDQEQSNRQRAREALAARQQ
ncbi:hypothetical protein NHH03_12955 [Stieleria sp. TO1_6]|uniref:hypothetical protein n=1 Tax=Stieleria tagensis TaxID=2956795 RepID=UPI00209B2BFB|nr:hypothetical protein [Stieleria tagensis]MCO8122649.1 hypothetical protein [Stieleria tagensis]